MTAKEKIATYITQTSAPVEPSELGKALGYSRVTIHDTLNELVREGSVVRKGNAPKTTYTKVNIDSAGYKIIPLTQGFTSSVNAEGYIAKYAVKQQSVLSVFVFYVSISRIMEPPYVQFEDLLKKALLRIKVQMMERGIEPYEEYVYEYIGDHFNEAGQEFFYSRLLKHTNTYRKGVEEKLTDKAFFGKFCKGHGIEYMGYFGSYAKGTATPQSDLDIMIDLKNKDDAYGKKVEIKALLNDYFKAKVDIISPHLIKQGYEESIFSNLKDLYGKRER